MRRALRRRRRLRIGLVQAIFVAVALLLALVMPSLDAGPDIDNDTVTTLLFSLAGGLIALITLVFSLLFLVVPYANTSLSPRLTLFRDDPVVWRSFAFFVAVFVFLTVSGLSLSGRPARSPSTSRSSPCCSCSSPPPPFARCSSRAYRSLQFGGTIMDITSGGCAVDVGVLYQDAIRTDSARSRRPAAGHRGRALAPRPVHPSVRSTCLTCCSWPPGPTPSSRSASASGTSSVGDVVVMVVRGHPAGDHTSSGRLLRMVEVGADRTFDQDPLFAFRLLVDIALRSLSSAITTISAVQAIGGPRRCTSHAGWPTVRARFVCC